MKTTIEEINGVTHSVIRHTKVITPKPEQYFVMPSGIKHLLVLENDGGVNCYATALPPLPKHPKPEDARLLHLYAAHGITVVGEGTIDFSREELNHLSTMEIEQLKDVTITHAIDTETGERVGVAIKE